MAEFITDVVTPQELTGFVREEVNGGLPFEGIFPVLPIDDIMYELTNVDLTGFNEVARYRSWDTVPPIGKRPGVTLIGGEIPPLAWAYRLNEEDIGRFGRVRQNLGSRTDARVVDTIFNDARRAAQAVQNRLTLAHAELLQSGTVTLTELGQPVSGNAIVATFAVPGDQIGVVPSGAAWTDRTTSVPLTDLLAWEAIYAANNNDEYPEAWLISKAALLDLTLNVQVRNAAPWTRGISGSTAPPLLQQSDVAQVLTLAGVQAPVRVVDIKRPPLAGGGRTAVLNARKIIGVKAGMGRTLYGVPPVTAVMAGNATIQRNDAPGIVAYATSDIRPPSVITTAEAVSMPVLTDPAGLFVATV